MQTCLWNDIYDWSIQDQPGHIEYGLNTRCMRKKSDRSLRTSYNNITEAKYCVKHTKARVIRKKGHAQESYPLKHAKKTTSNGCRPHYKEYPSHSIQYWDNQKVIQ